MDDDGQDNDRTARRASVVEHDLPRRLRAERERRKISVRELARRIDVTPSAISQIETGRARPSVSTLYAISSELGMSLDELLGDGRASRPVPVPERDRSAPAPVAPVADREDAPVQRASDRVVIALETGVLWERLTAGHDPDVDFLHVVYPVGASSSPNRGFIRHAGREYGVVLSGRLEVSLGFETYQLAAGDSISLDSTEPHRLSNAGDEPATAVWITIGRRGRLPETAVPDALRASGEQGVADEGIDPGHASVG